MKEYDESIDYKKDHLAWIDVKKFKPEGWVPSAQFPSYYSQMSQMYYDGWFIQHKTAYTYYKDDYDYLATRCSILERAKDMFGDAGQDGNEWFVTIGFNHQVFTPLRAHNYVMSLFKKSFVTDAYGAFEFHTETGEHPHFMFYLKTDCKSKGRVVDRIFQSAGSRNLILAKNFINVQPFQQRHVDYINGNKTDNKMEFVLADRLWRNANNLPEIIRK